MFSKKRNPPIYAIVLLGVVISLILIVLVLLATGKIDLFGPCGLFQGPCE